MRKTFAPALVLTLLALGVAGLAWAAQAAIEAPQNAVEATPEPQPAAETTQLAEGIASGEISLEGLFQEPVKMQDPCCFVACRDEWNNCKNGCGGNQACLSLCATEYEACLDNC